MKDRRHTDNVEQNGPNDLIYVYSRIHIYDHLALKDEESDQNANMIFFECVHAVGADELTSHGDELIDELIIECVIAQPASEEPLQDMEVFALVTVGGLMDQAFVHKKMQQRQRAVEAFASESDEVVELTDDEEMVMSFRAQQLEDDKLRIAIVDCHAGSISSEPPIATATNPDDNVNASLPTIPINTIQDLLNCFVEEFIVSSRLFEEPTDHINVAGDGRWCSADMPAPSPPAPKIDYEKSVELDGDWYRVWELTREIADSIRWDYGADGAMRGDPSRLFWKAWHADKEAMRKLGFRVYKPGGVWSVFVKDPSLINLFRKCDWSISSANTDQRRKD